LQYAQKCEKLIHNSDLLTSREYTILKTVLLGRIEYSLDELVVNVLATIKVKVKLSLYMPWGPLGLREFEIPTFSHIRLTWRQGRQPYAPAAFYPQKDSWYSFLFETESTL
jgi:hypothetical protein